MTTNAPSLGGDKAADQPLPRTPEEILTHMREADGFFDFTAEVCVEALSYEVAAQFLTDEYKAKVAAGEEVWAPMNTREAVIAKMRDYMEFAWMKCRDERGLSASRSVSKFTAWCWLLGDEESCSGPYGHYGDRILTAVCKKYGFPIES